MFLIIAYRSPQWDYIPTLKVAVHGCEHVKVVKGWLCSEVKEMRLTFAIRSAKSSDGKGAMGQGSKYGSPSMFQRRFTNHIPDFMDNSGLYQIINMPMQALFLPSSEVMFQAST